MQVTSPILRPKRQININYADPPNKIPGHGQTFVAAQGVDGGYSETLPPARSTTDDH